MKQSFFFTKCSLGQNLVLLLFSRTFWVTYSLSWKKQTLSTNFYLKIDYWQMVSVCFSDNCGQILQVGWEEGSVGGCQTGKLGLPKTLKICSHVTRQWEVQSHQMQLEEKRRKSTIKKKKKFVTQGRYMLGTKQCPLLLPAQNMYPS